jgi:L-malate glycosyltransferase
MKLIFCVEFYYPSVGGAQEVVRQLAERLAVCGHEVIVATSHIAERASDTHNGVRIAGFHISGNRVRGISGELDRFQEFLLTADADLVFFYAAQQWTFDAAWDVLSSLRARKVLVPCGYSGLFLDSYVDYFSALPTVLAQMDAVVYHAQSYRDIDFARAHGLQNSLIIPNGAAGEEFQVGSDPGFRALLGADGDTLLLLTVGTVTGLKGHFELTRAFELANFGQRKAILILNGNQPYNDGRRPCLQRFAELVRGYGPTYAIRHAVKMFLSMLGWRSASLNSIIARINSSRYGNKHVLRVDLPRPQLIQAYLQSDLFVFASNIEYSPLVLFEACAAGLPFLTVPVGNATEIVRWTGGGELCEAPVDAEGYTRVEPAVLARSIEKLVADPAYLVALGAKGKRASKRRFNWASLTIEYEQLFRRLTEPSRTVCDVVERSL